MNLFNEKKNINKTTSSRSFSFAKLFRKRKEKEEDDSYALLDEKLVYSLSSHKIPSIKQIKYLKKTLSFKEKMFVNVFLSIIFFVLIFIGFKFYKKSIKIIPNFGGVYTEAILGAPKNINPLYNLARDADKDISSFVFSSLFKRSADGLLKKDIVKDYKISEDGKEYSFQIRDDVWWHHNEKMLVDDIVFTFEAIKNSDYSSPLRSSFIGVEIEKIDDFDFKFILVEPYAAFLDLLVFGVISQNLWMNIDPVNAPLAELNLKPIGSGPYKFKSLTKNKNGEIKEMSFVANEKYYDQTPYIANLNFKFFTYTEEMVSALNNNQVDGLSYLPHGLNDSLISQNSLSFNRLNLPQISSLFFSQKNKKFLETKDVRKSLALSIDKKALVNKIFSGNAGLAHGPILPDSFAYNEDIEKYDYNPGEAEKILDDLKWARIYMDEGDVLKIKNLISLEENKIEANAIENQDLDDSTGVIIDNNDLVLAYKNDLKKAREEVEGLDDWQLKKKIVKDLKKDSHELVGDWRVKGSEYLFINLTTVDLSDNIDVANFVKSSWDSVGVKTFIKIINVSQIQTEILKNRDFEALLLTQVVGSDPDSYVFWHSSQSGENGLNICSYKNREVDKLLEGARMSLSVDDRVDKYKKFQEILNNDLPAIFLYFPNYTYVQNKKIKGFDILSISEPSDRFNNISNWYIKTKRIFDF